MKPSFTMLAFTLLVHGCVATTLNPNKEVELAGKGQAAPKSTADPLNTVNTATTVEEVGLMVKGRAGPKLSADALKTATIATTVKDVGLMGRGQAALKSPVDALNTLNIATPVEDIGLMVKGQAAPELPAEALQAVAIAPIVKENIMRQQGGVSQLLINPAGEMSEAYDPKQDSVEKHAEHKEITMHPQKGVRRFGINPIGEVMEAADLLEEHAQHNGLRNTNQAEECSYKVHICRADCKKEWIVLDVTSFDGDTFKFDGCSKDATVHDASWCIELGNANGVNTLVNSKGEIKGTGVCCNGEQNEVLDTKNEGCKEEPEPEEVSRRRRKSQSPQPPSINDFKTGARRNPFSIWAMMVPCYVAWACSQE